jgi:hypothetical protein
MINDHDTPKPRPRVLPIARAGREILGIGQAASYEAVRRGQWPTIKRWPARPRRHAPCFPIVCGAAQGIENQLTVDRARDLVDVSCTAQVRTAPPSCCRARRPGGTNTRIALRDRLRRCAG